MWCREPQQAGRAGSVQCDLLLGKLASRWQARIKTMKTVKQTQTGTIRNQGSKNTEVTRNEPAQMTGSRHGPKCNRKGREHNQTQVKRIRAERAIAGGKPETEGGREKQDGHERNKYSHFDFKWNIFVSVNLCRITSTFIILWPNQKSKSELKISRS